MSKEDTIKLADVESNLIALLIQNPTAIYDTTINKSYFTKTEGGHNPNRALFSIMEYLAKNKDMEKLEFDPATIATLAYQDEALKKVLNNVFDGKKDTLQYLKALQEYEVSKKNLDIYENELIKARMTNDLLEENEQKVEDIIENYNNYTADEIANELEKSILKVTNSFIDRDEQPEHIADGMRKEYMQRNPNEKGFKGLSSGVDHLDKFTGGILREGAMTVINALSGVGKSIFIKQVVKHVGVDLELPVYWGASEQPKNEQRDRIIAEIANVPIKIVENGLYNKPGYIEVEGRQYNTEKLKERVLKAVKTLEESEIHIDEMKGATPERLMRRAKFYKKRYDIQLFAYDYIDDSYGRNNEELRHFLTRMATYMKQEIADKLGLSVITAAQAHDYEPWHTRESKGIEKKCTTLVWLRELSKKERNENPLGGTHGISIPKNRNGKKHQDFKDSWLSLDFDKKTLEFYQAR